MPIITLVLVKMLCILYVVFEQKQFGDYWFFYGSNVMRNQEAKRLDSSLLLIPIVAESSIVNACNEKKCLH